MAAHARLESCTVAAALISLCICTQPTQTCLRMAGNHQAFIWHSFISWQCSHKQPGMLLLFMIHKVWHDYQLYHIFFLCSSWAWMCKICIKTQRSCKDKQTTKHAGHRHRMGMCVGISECSLTEENVHPRQITCLMSTDIRQVKLLKKIFTVKSSNNRLSRKCSGLSPDTYGATRVSGQLRIQNYPVKHHIKRQLN